MIIISREADSTSSGSGHNTQPDHGLQTFTVPMIVPRPNGWFLGFTKVISRFGSVPGRKSTPGTLNRINATTIRDSVGYASSGLDYLPHTQSISCTSIHTRKHVVRCGVCLPSVEIWPPHLPRESSPARVESGLWRQLTLPIVQVHDGVNFEPEVWVYI